MDYSPGHLTCLYFILSYEDGFYKSNVLKVYPPNIWITAHNRLVVTFQYSISFCFIILIQMKERTIKSTLLTLNFCLQVFQSKNMKKKITKCCISFIIFCYEAFNVCSNEIRRLSKFQNSKIPLITINRSLFKNNYALLRFQRHFCCLNYFLLSIFFTSPRCVRTKYGLMNYNETRWDVRLKLVRQFKSD